MSFGQGGPQWSPGGSTGPDWSALAEEAERKRVRRRRRLVAGGGALATVLVAAIVAVAVVSENDDPKAAGPSPSQSPADDRPSGSAEPKPSFKEELPPAPPEDYLTDAKVDKAPLSEDSLFPDKSVTINGREYRQAATDATEDCAAATQGDLGAVLKKHECAEMFRATYEREGLAFTVGVAVFGTEEKAASVKTGYEPNVASLKGGDVPTYCRTVVCRTTVNALGRYAFFTIAGHTDGTPAGDSDKAAKQVALDGSDYAYARILQRGKEQAEADAAAG